MSYVGWLLGGVFLVFIGVTQLSYNYTPLSITGVQDIKFDGCSLFPDGDYTSCCDTHDQEYFVGGSAYERLRSDNRLLQCVGENSKYGYPLGILMWSGVRIGGAPIFPTPFRWGFGEDYIE